MPIAKAGFTFLEQIWNFNIYQNNKKGATFVLAVMCWNSTVALNHIPLFVFVCVSLWVCLCTVQLLGMLDMSVPVVAKFKRLLDSLPRETLPDVVASMIRTSNKEKLQVR